MPAMHSVIPTNFVVNFPRRSQSNDHEKNMIAAILCALVIVLLVLALALPNWYYLKGDGCPRKIHTEKDKEKIVLYSTRPGFIPKAKGNTTFSSLTYYGFNQDLENCLTSEIVTLQRVILGLCLLSIIFSFKQFLTDILGVKSSIIDCSRRCGLGSIISVMIIVVIIGLCYYTTDLIEHQQDLNKMYPSPRVEVTFGASYYLIASAGILSVFATAASLFRCDHLVGNSDTSSLLDDHQEETFSIALPHSESWSHIHDQNAACINSLPPPPPYTP